MAIFFIIYFIILTSYQPNFFSFYCFKFKFNKFFNTFQKKWIKKWSGIIKDLQNIVDTLFHIILEGADSFWQHKFFSQFTAKLCLK